MACNLCMEYVSYILCSTGTFRNSSVAAVKGAGLDD